MDMDKKAKALLDDGIIVKKEDIVASGVITHIEYNNSTQVINYKRTTTTFPIMSTTNIDFVADRVYDRNLNSLDRYYIVKARE